MASGFRRNSRGYEEILKGAVVRAGLTRRAECVADAARASAPVESGGYRDSIRLQQDTTDRAVVRVVADISHGAAVESRTGNLSRALDAAGCES